MYKPLFFPKQKKVASLDDMTAFPDLVKVSSSDKVTESVILDFKAKLETDVVLTLKPVWKQPTKRMAAHYNMGKLTERYLQWKREYIDNYGEDDYEHRYRFPNYDYEYYDKLDEIYERMVLAEEEEERLRELDDEFVTEEL